ncbi:MAG: hypothetical protein K8I27_09585 [Planctomycetes bacterium]|nr:hypothetical protein [Planctomycetota bacterium]
MPALTSRLLACICLFFVAACASQPAVPTASDDGSFVAAEVAPDAGPADAPANNNDRLKPLTTDEEAQGALLVNKLDTAEDQVTRESVLGELVALGPRYLEFFRSIDRDSLVLDMMYVVRRIEREHNVGNPGEQPAYTGKEPTTPAIKGSGEIQTRRYEPGTEEYDRESVERFMAERLSQAQLMMDGGNHSGAVKIAEAAITLMPETRLRTDFDALILRAKGESQADLIIAGTMSLQPSHLHYSKDEKGAPFAAPLLIQCFLKNVSSKAITLRLYEGEGKESILQLSITYEQLDYQGNVMSQRGNVRLPINAGDSIILQPNESYSMDVPLESLASLDADAPLKYALGNVRIDAALRVYGALDDDGNGMILRPIQFPTRDVLIYPAKYDLSESTNRPLTSMRKSLDDGAAQDLYMTAHLVGTRERRSAGDILLGEEFEESTLAMKRARLKALTIIFKTGANWDIKQWRSWWQENRLKQ